MDLDEKNIKIEKLLRQIKSCQRCELFKTRTNVVPGDGDINSSVMFIGEAPGSNEDLKGKPFVGRAGDILNRLLTSINLTREQIYICNILKCRPPGNRNPLPKEIEACQGSLEIQLKVINPKVICTLGNFSTEYILKRFKLPLSKISAIHGKVYEVEIESGTVYIIPLFHPAVATYNVKKIDEMLIDMKSVSKIIQDQKLLMGANS